MLLKHLGSLYDMAPLSHGMTQESIEVVPQDQACLGPMMWKGSSWEASPQWDPRTPKGGSFVSSHFSKDKVALGP